MAAIFGLAFRSAVSNPRRLLFYVLTIGFLVMVISAPTAIANGYSKNLLDLIPETKGNRVLLVNSSAPPLAGGYLSYSIAEDLRELGFKKVFPQLLARLKIRVDGKSAPIRVRGIDNAHSFYKGKGFIVNGILPSSKLEVNAGILLARRLGLSIGDVIEMLGDGKPWRLEIAGIIDCKCPSDDELLTPLSTLWEIMPDLDGKVSLIEAAADTGFELDELNLNGVKVLPERPFRKAAITLIETTFQSAKSWVTPIYAIILVATYFTSSKISSDSEKELAILKCIGASRKSAFAYVFYKSLITASLAIMVGLALGVVSAQVIYRILSLLLSIESYIAPGLQPFDLIHIALLAYASALVGSLYPALRASRREVGESVWRSTYQP